MSVSRAARGSGVTSKAAVKDGGPASANRSKLPASIDGDFAAGCQDTESEAVGSGGQERFRIAEHHFEVGV